MIENRSGISKSMEKALKNYEQAKQRVANEYCCYWQLFILTEN